MALEVFDSFLPIMQRTTYLEGSELDVQMPGRATWHSGNEKIVLNDGFSFMLLICQRESWGFCFEAPGCTMLSQDFSGADLLDGVVTEQAHGVSILLSLKAGRQA